MLLLLYVSTTYLTLILLLWVAFSSVTMVINANFKFKIVRRIRLYIAPFSVRALKMFLQATNCDKKLQTFNRLILI